VSKACSADGACGKDRRLQRHKGRTPEAFDTCMFAILPPHPRPSGAHFVGTGQSHLKIPGPWHCRFRRGLMRGKTRWLLKPPSHEHAQRHLGPCAWKQQLTRAAEHGTHGSHAAQAQHREQRPPVKRRIGARGKYRLWLRVCSPPARGGVRVFRAVTGLADATGSVASLMLRGLLPC
jgi:hypothetical protein